MQGLDPRSSKNRSSGSAALVHLFILSKRRSIHKRWCASRFLAGFRAGTVTGVTILRKSNDSVPVETRLQLVLAVLAHELTVAEAARRLGVSAESINRWRNRFIDAGKIS